jgi:two-component system chemotaxis response regulator CheB
MGEVLPRVLRVLVVDDSAVVRLGVRALLAGERDVVVEAVSDPLFALERMRRERPDVVLLDMEMPRMDGLTFLRQVMREDPLPVVVCSALADGGPELARQALEEGALEVIAKPSLGVGDFLRVSQARLVASLRRAARTVPQRRGGGPSPSLPPTTPLLKVTTDQVVAVGASTGGTEALRALLQPMPPDSPGLVIVQHMPEHFTKSFARSLRQMCRIDVKEAEAGDRVYPGRALLAPGNRHLRVRRSGGEYRVEVLEGPYVSGHRPSVDVLFHSVARAAGANAVGVLLTGMGADGADGLLAMRRAGAATVAQDEASCVVFGMPRVAIAQGAVDEVLPLSAIGDAVRRLVGGRARPHSG